MKTITGLVVTLALCGSAFAQAKPEVKTHTAVCGSIPAPDTGFTECEMDKLIALSTKIKDAIAPFQQQGAALISQVERENPGKTYENPTQAYPYGRLVPKVEQPEAKK
jgi:hypothetical protein